MHNYLQQGILWTWGITTSTTNIANKTTLFNDFLKFKFQENIQEKNLQVKEILK